MAQIQLVGLASRSFLLFCLELLLVELLSCSSAVLHVLIGQEVLQILSKRQSTVGSASILPASRSTLVLLVLFLGYFVTFVHALQRLLRFLVAFCAGWLLSLRLLLCLCFLQALQQVCIDLFASAVELIFQGAYCLL